MNEELLAKAVRNGRFVVTAECRPPRGTDVSRLQACAKALGDSVDAVYAPESEDGVRLSSLAACGHLAAGGAEPILSLLTRDLNRIALQSAILGAASNGVNNVLCLTGRHQTLTTSGSAKGVFDVDQVQLLQVADGIRKSGTLADGEMLDSPVPLVLGTDTNPFAEPVELHVIALEKAVRAGADFVITAPVFNVAKFGAWMDEIRKRGVHDCTCIIASVMPLKSSREITNLSDRYGNVGIPEQVIDKIKNASDQRAAGVEIAKETIEALRKIEGVRGVHMMTGDDFELAADIIKASGLARS